MGKKKAKKQADDDWEAEFEAATNGLDLQEPVAAATKATKPESESEPEPVPEPEADPAPNASAKQPAGDDGEPEIRILTKSEKEKIKKEKEKAKKLAKKQRQKEQAKAAAAATANASSDGENAKTDKSTTLGASDEISADGGDGGQADVGDDAADGGGGDGDGDGDGDGNGDGDINDGDGDDTTSSSKKKKKKKKKAAAADEKPKKKGTAMGALLKQRLQEQEAADKALREEEDRLRKIAEEEERKAQEEERLAQERKEAKKQREREKKEKLRAEGKLLSAKEKEKKRLAEIKRKQLEEAGLLPPSGSSADGPKKVNYGKKKPKKVEEVQREVVVEVVEAEVKNPEDDDDVKDDWDASSEEDEPEMLTEPEPAPEPVSSMSVERAKDSKKEKEAAVAAAAAAVEETSPQDTTSYTDYGGCEVGSMRSPICCVLGHVDTGKTKILDKIRKTTVQDGEAGGITQQIGASFFPVQEIRKQTERVKGAANFDWKIPGLLVMDTPGHESFSNLRDRGSSLCNLAVLVVDIMHGLEPQTIESINLLKKKKTPFIVALNKVDRVHDWKPTPNMPIQASLKKQKEHTKQQFQILSERAKLALMEQGFNCELYYENKDFRKTLSIVPTSAHTGEGIPDLLFLISKLTQGVLGDKIVFTDNLNCTVLEVKKIDGHGTTIDVILADGTLREGQKIVLAGLDGPIITTIRSLLMPEPLKELRVKNAYRKFSAVSAANGVKIAAKDMEKAVAGMQLVVVESQEEADRVAADLAEELEATLKGMKVVESGVHVQASTLGSLEALLEFLKESKIPVSGLSIGPVHKKDIVRASVQLERDRKFALILAFDVPVEREAEQHAKALGIKIFTANIIYHLFDAFTKHIEEEKARLRAQYAPIAIFPCEIKILPDAVFNTRDPIVVGVTVVDGLLRVGTKLCTGTAPDWCDLGVVTSMEFDHKPLELAHPGQEVCIKIDPMGGDKKLLGRHFQVTDKIISRISRESIDAVKAYFKEDLKKSDWKLMLKLKNLFEII